MNVEYFFGGNQFFLVSGSIFYSFGSYQGILESNQLVTPSFSNFEPESMENTALCEL